MNYSGMGGIASGMYDMFGKQKNPYDSAQQYWNQISNANQYNQPYYNAGIGQLGQLSGQYGQLMNDPGGKFNQIGESFHESPGFKFALDQALGANQRQQAAGGMAGSPMHEQQNMTTATGLANQDYYNYMNGAMGLYGQGLQGAQGMANQGQQAGNNMADMIAQQLAMQGAGAFGGQKYQNDKFSNAWGNIFGGLGSMF
jgi:hypothetical protein